MYYRNEGDQVKGSLICLGVQPEIQDPNRKIDF
jgi:hypothetical protein